MKELKRFHTPFHSGISDTWCVNQSQVVSPLSPSWRHDPKFNYQHSKWRVSDPHHYILLLNEDIHKQWTLKSCVCPSFLPSFFAFFLPLFIPPSFLLFSFLPSFPFFSSFYPPPSFPLSLTFLSSFLSSLTIFISAFHFQEHTAYFTFWCAWCFTVENHISPCFTIASKIKVRLIGKDLSMNQCLQLRF